MLKGYETKDRKKIILKKNETNYQEHRVKRTAEREGLSYVELEGSESGKASNISQGTKEVT